MQQNSLHILSQTPAQISANGQILGVIDNKNLFEIDIITQTDKVFLNHAPISYNDTALSYTCEILTSATPHSENSYINIIPFPNNNYDIIMNPFFINTITNPKVLINKNVDKYFVSIISDQNTKIVIYSGSSIIFEKTAPALHSAKAETKKNLILIQGIIDQDNYYMLILDTNDFKIIYEDRVQSIEENENYLQTLKNLRDISHHSQVIKIDYANKSLEKYFVYQDNYCKNALSPLLIPQDFLECLSCQDANKCNQLLSPHIQNTPLAKFNNYFGDIQKIYLNRHFEYQDKINYTIYNGSYRNFDFLMKNNQIEDIEEVF